MNLFYDFETTGLVDFKVPSRAEHQPHIVQLAAILADDDGVTIASVDLIAKPDGWDIPKEASDVHGITTEQAMDFGIPERLLVLLLRQLWQISTLRIGHNQSFDARIMRIALFRFYDRKTADEWKAGPAYCTCDKSTQLCARPPTEKMMAAGHHNFKRPNLAEAYLAATGKEIEGAHSAMPDVLACKAVFEWIRRKEAS